MIAANSSPWFASEEARKLYESGKAPLPGTTPNPMDCESLGTCPRVAHTLARKSTDPAIPERSIR